MISVWKNNIHLHLLFIIYNCFYLFIYLLFYYFMATYKRFEDLPVWQHARRFAANAETLIENSLIKRNFKLSDQMLASSGSVMDNIAEGFERSGNKEFANFLYIAKGSAGEFRSQLYRALDGNRISMKEFQPIHDEAEQISTEIQNFIKYLSTSGMKGYKYSKGLSISPPPQFLNL